MADPEFKSKMSIGLIGEDLEYLSIVTSKYDFEGKSKSNIFWRLVLILP